MLQIKNTGSNNIASRWLFAAIIVFSILLFLLSSGSIIFFSNKVIPGIRLGNVPIGGKTPEEVTRILKKYETRVESGIPFEFYDRFSQKRIVNIQPNRAFFDNPVTDTTLFTLHKERILRQIFSFGHTRSLVVNVSDLLRASFGEINIPLIASWNEPTLKALLASQLESYALPPVNARLQLEAKEEAGYSVSLLPEVVGRDFDYDAIVHLVEQWLEGGGTSVIEIALERTDPDITRRDVPNDIKTQVGNVLSLAPITGEIPSPDGEISFFELNQALLMQSLQMERNEQSGEVELTMEKSILIPWLETIATKIVREPKNAKFAIEDGKVIEFEQSKSGWKLPIERSYHTLVQTVLRSLQKTVSLTLETTEAPITLEKVNNLGIQEVVGIGYSSFAGSPKNRIHNITVGSQTLNGILIAPGEEFSLLKALGPIELEAGYLPELVIKGNRTIPEVGGGLCQIGTTMFRAAMATGLPVMERQNHSFTVQYYYEDGVPGTDATIYPPHPDLRFINDTGNSILVLTKIDSTDLSFEMWGTKDGRTSERTKPTLSNIIPAPPQKTIETTDLPVGTKRCTEKPHGGVTTAFDYMITYPNGEVKKQTFTSVYRPWQAICLVGVEKQDEPEDDTKKENLISIPSIESNTLDQQLDETD